MELMDATWRPLFLLYNNGSCFLSLSADEDKLILIYLQHMLLHKRDFHRNIHAV